MFDALYIGATGMQAQQLNVDTIANNLANVNTAGFKKARVTFADLVSRPAYSQTVNGGNEASLLEAVGKLGSGVGVASVTKMHDVGDLKKTDAPLDIAIEGDGFIELTLPDGTQAFARGGTLKVNQDGLLATQSGYPLKPGISIPSDAQSLVISKDGIVQVRVTNQSTAVEVGRLGLVKFSNPQGLISQGDNLYRQTEQSGDAVSGTPGDDGLGRFAQGFLEGSNVRMVDEMVNLMIAQRAYEASVKVVQASDEMLGMINALRK